MKLQVLFVLGFVVRLTPFACAITPTPAPATWDDYGAVPNSPTTDNGPILSRMLADQLNRKLKLPPVGTLADYYIKSSIYWPQGTGGALEGAGGYTYAYSLPNIGCTRIIWNGPPGQPMIVYRGSGSRIGRLILCGGPRSNEYKSVAGTGIIIESRNEPPSGNLFTDQLAVTQCDVGLHYLATPDFNHADQQKHFGLLFHKVRIPYWVESDQSVVHWLYGCDIRGGYEQAFRFDKGGCLAVFGCYLGVSDGGTLLYIGAANDHVGDFEIHGLQVDGSVKQLKLLDYGKYAFRVRIDGNVGFASQLADPFVVMREGPTKFADVKIDCRNAQWANPGQ